MLLFTALYSLSLNARSSRLQIIHNAAGAAYDSLDIYINNIKINNLRFRHATPRFAYNSGNYKININNRSSTDSGNQVLFSRTINIQNGQRLVIMIQGVENPANYAPNPLGKPTGLSINVTNISSLPSGNNVSYTFLNGITDSRKVNVHPRNLPQVFNDIEYTVYENSFLSLNTTINNNFTNSPKIFNLSSSDGQDIYSTKQFPIQNNNFRNNNVVLVASGFINPVINNNRPKAELFAVDSAGGPFISGTRPTRTGIQIIHNSPDVLLDTIDIYVNNTKYNNMAFRSATPLLNLPAGSYQINFNNKNSNDSADGVLLRYHLQLDTGITNTLFLIGVVNPQLYFPNGSNISTALSVHKVASDYSNRTASDRTQVVLVNGSFDSRHNDFHLDNSSLFPVLFGSENKLTGALPLTTSTQNRISINNGDVFILQPQILPNSSVASHLSFVFSSGFAFPNQINQTGQALGLFRTDSSGRVLPLNPAISQVQFIHNSADVSMDTVDVYFNNVKINDIAFRESSGSIFVNEGIYLVNINHKQSVDSSHMVIARIPVVVTPNTSTNNWKSVYMLMGVSNPNLYVRTPGLATELRLIKSDNFPAQIGASNNQVYEIMFHGSTDLGLLSVGTTPTTSSLRIPIDSNFTYSKVTVLSSTQPINTYLRLSPFLTPTSRKGFDIPLQQFARKSVVFFTSGFLNPSANQNGKPYGLFVVDSSKGPAVTFQEACIKQFIHATSDTSVGNIDIWQGEKRIVSNLKPNTATPIITLLTNDTVLYVTKAGATQKQEQLLLTDSMAAITSSSTNYAILAGRLDTNTIAKNPTGISTKLGFSHISFDETDNPSAGTFRLSYFNAVPDADSINLLRRHTSFVSQSSIYNRKIPYRSFITQSFPLPQYFNGLRELLETIKGDTIRSYRFLNQNFFSGKDGILFNSSSINDLQASYHIAFKDGTIHTLPPLLSQVQFIHASADTSLKQIDIYANGQKIANAMPYPSATPLINFAAKRRSHIKITEANSLSDSVALFTFNFKPDTAQRLHAVLNGVLTPASFKANPEGINTSLNITLDTGFKFTSANNNNVDLKFFNASTDSRKINVRAQSQQAFLGYFNSYKTYRNYIPNPSTNNIIYNVAESGVSTNLFAAEANLLQYKGQAGIAILHGFNDTTNNQNGNPLKLFIAWPDGSVDTLRKIIVTTGLSDFPIGLNQEINATLYPNPAIDNTQLTIIAKQNSSATIKIFDTQGKCLFNHPIQLKSDENNFEINTESLANGIYFCIVEHASGNIALKLFVAK